MIESKLETLFDKIRNREIPVKIYYPSHSALDAESKTPEQVRGVKSPVIVFSHGLGGSCESYKYIGEYFAAHGFTSYHPTHYGIDDRLLKEKRPFQLLKEAGEARENLINPPLDVKFVIDHFQLNDICMAGHSFGSYTTLALCGQDVSKLGEEIEFKDSRIKCGIVISPHAVLNSPELAYDEIDIPLLHITGKLDNSPFGLFEPIQRRIPYDHIKHGNQHLMIFEWADHMVFAAQRRGNKFSAKDINVMKLTCELSLEFLKKYLLNTDSALDTPAFLDKVVPHGKLERK